VGVPAALQTVSDKSTGTQENSDMSQIVLYGAPGGSPFVRKVQIVLAEKSLAHEHVPTIPVEQPPPGASFPGISAALRPHTPLGKIPFARIGARWLADSSVIIAYLDRLHPQPPLYPADPWEYSQAVWFEEYIDGGAVPKLFNTVFFERLIAPMLLGRATDEAVVERALADDLPTVYGYLDGQVGARAYLAGERFSVADVAAAAFFWSMRQADAPPDAARWPDLTRYVARLHGRPAVARLMQQEETRASAGAVMEPSMGPRRGTQGAIDGSPADAP
jgi:glutathione S-transferase